MEATTLFHINTVLRYDVAMGSHWLRHFKAGGLICSPFMLQVGQSGWTARGSATAAQGCLGHSTAVDHSHISIFRIGLVLQVVLSMCRMHRFEKALMALLLKLAQQVRAQSAHCVRIYHSHFFWERFPVL